MSNNDPAKDIKTAGGMTLMFFPQVYQELNREILYHPALAQLLSNHLGVNEGTKFETMLAEICAYCRIIVDGEFTQSGLEALAAKCLEQLQLSRRLRIIS